MWIQYVDSLVNTDNIEKISIEMWVEEGETNCYLSFHFISGESERIFYSTKEEAQIELKRIVAHMKEIERKE
jgi:hypothetical protein